MATGPNQILIKRSDVASNEPSGLPHGEIAINTADGKLFFTEQTSGESSGDTWKFHGFTNEGFVRSVNGQTGDVVISGSSFTSYGADDGLTLNGNTFSIDSTAVIVVAGVSLNSSGITFADGTYQDTAAYGVVGGTGPTGPTGPQGNTGPTGDGFFDISHPTGTTLNHSINFDNINTVSGDGRKFPVLLGDGSITFDYIRAQDIFLDSEFVFGINSFSISGSSIVLIGSGNYSLSGRSLSASYQEPGSISVSDAEVVTNASSDSGFPIDLTTGSASLTTETIAYPASKNTSITFTLGATGSDSSYVTATDTITFRNNNYYGVTSNASLDGTDLLSLTGFLDNNRASSVSVNAGDGEYIYYAYPSSYGDASFTVGGFAGGFSKLHGGATAHTNASGFTETYFIYRSDNASLGSTTVVVS